MQISWSSISAGAMTAAVSLGSAAQTLGAGAAAAVHSLPSVAGAGAQVIASGATTAAQVLPGLPGGVEAGAAHSATFARDLGMVDKSVQAAAKGVPRSSMVLRAATFLRTALPVAAIGASALAGAQVLKQDGADGLLHTKRGRGAVLGALGGTLLLVPHPATQFVAAGVLGASAMNEFGGLERFDRASSAPKTT